MSDTKGKIVEIDLNDILPNRLQPRIKFNEDSIMELSESIKVHGVLQPIIVRPISDKYEIIAGERRYKASVIAGLETIPATIIAYNDKDSAEVALIENIQRKDLTSIEEAISYKKILDMGYLTQEQLASKLGKSQSSIANKIRLLNLCDDVQEALMEEKISERHARSLLKLKNSSSQRYLLKRIMKERLTVRKTDDEIEKILSGEIVVEVDEDDNKKEIKTEFNDILEKDDNKNNLDISIDNKEEKKSSEEFDITDFFDEKELDDFLKLISEDHVTKEEKVKENDVILEQDDEEILNDDKLIQVEKEENDKMINDYQSINSQETSQGGKFFNIQNSNDDSQNSSFFKSNDDLVGNSNNKISDLMAPEGSKNLLHSNENSVQDTIFSSMTEQNQLPKGSIFGDLMKNQDSPADNSYVDGETLGKFLDPSYVDGNKQEVNQDNVINSSVFAKFLDQDYNNKVTSSSNSVESISNIKPIEENTNQFIQPQSIIEPKTENNKFDFLLSTNNASESTNDDIFVQQKAANEDNLVKPIDLLSPTPLMNDAIDTQNKNDIFVTNNVSNFSNDSKPDLLAPMGNESSSISSFVNPISQPEVTEEIQPNNNFSSLLNTNDGLTPDNSINETLESVPLETESDTISPIPTTLDHPFFVTASTPTIETSMPTTPIFDNPDNSKLLSSNFSTEEPEVPKIVENEPTTIAESIQPEPEIEIPGPVTNQTIIVTDYNKQYDPIFPNVTKEVEPQIDMRNIISMIRDLGSKIEQYGYSVDLDEIDLVDSYQVTFNIIKK